nr:MAG TPA: hypothetical protein [Caudoviricetes sp.]
MESNHSTSNTALLAVVHAANLYTPFSGPALM